MTTRTNRYRGNKSYSVQKQIMVQKSAVGLRFVRPSWEQFGLDADYIATRITALRVILQVAESCNTPVGDTSPRWFRRCGTGDGSPQRLAFAASVDDGTQSEVARRVRQVREEGRCHSARACPDGGWGSGCCGKTKPLSSATTAELRERSPTNGTVSCLSSSNPHVLIE